MIIRIITEDKNPERIRELTEKQFAGFTMYRGMGSWKGKSEPSVTIEIAVLGGNAIDLAFNAAHDCTRARVLAAQIKAENNQEAVLIEFIDSENILV